MKVAIRFISDLTEDEINKLNKIRQTDSNFRLRNRAHAILLSAQKKPINEISQICQVGRDAISQWLSRWQAGKFSALADADRSGRPKSLTQEEEAVAIQTALKVPHSPNQQMALVEAELGKPVSRMKLKRLLKKNTVGSESKEGKQKSVMK
jgi:transposase